MNSYNFVDDVVHYSSEEIAITGEKYIENVLVEWIQCDPCIIQDTDVNEWMARAVPNIGDHVIQGDVVFENLTVFGKLEVRGTVNGNVFNEQTVLLKNRDQVVTGGVTIQTAFVAQGLITPVFFEDVTVIEVNGRDVDNVILNGGSRKIAAKNLDFMAPLQAKKLHTNNFLVYNVDVEHKMRSLETQDNLIGHEDRFKALQGLSEMVREAQSTSTLYLSHIQIVKGLLGQFKKIVPLTFSDGHLRLAAFDPTDMIHSLQFYRYEARDGSFEIDDHLPPLSSGATSKITNIEALHLFETDLLVIEKNNGEIFEQIALGYFDNGFQRSLYYFNSTQQIHTASLVLNGIECVLRYSSLVPKSQIACRGQHGLFHFQQLEGAPISKSVTLPANNSSGDDLVILTMDGNLVVYAASEEGKLKLKQSLLTVNPVDVDGICRGLHCYIAICSEKTDHAVHFGAVEIYGSFNGSEYQQLQIIQVKSPMQVQFTLLASDDILLYVLTNNPVQSVIVYQYSGVAGFKEFVTGSTIPKGKSMTVIKLPDQREYLSLLTENGIVFIEPVLQSS